MFPSRLAAACLLLALGAGSSLASDYDHPLDRSRFPGHDEEAYNALPRDIVGRYPRPSAIGRDDRIPLGAYLPVPPNAFNEIRTFAPGEAAVDAVGPAGPARHYRGDLKGRASRDVRPSAWRGEGHARRAFVEPAPPADVLPE